jgi:hypothetical protein
MKLKHSIHTLIIFLILFTTQSIVGQTVSFRDTIHWEAPVKTQVTKDFSFTSLQFKNGLYPYANSVIPIYSNRKSIPIGTDFKEVRIVKLTTIQLSSEEQFVLDAAHMKSSIDSFSVKTSLYSERGKPFITLNFNPIFRNPRSHQLEKVVDFEMEIVLKPKTSLSKGRTYAANSVLANGNWYKIATSNEGVHIIRKQDIVAMGLNPAITDPGLVSVFGNGGSPLAQYNATPRRDDIAECAVTVVGGGDGRFDDNDYILFYAKSPVGWDYNSSTHQYDYKKNTFSDNAYYFVTFDASIGAKKRIQTAPAITDPVTQTITQYNRYLSYEKERVNLAKSGCDWLGETFDYTTSYSFPFRISNLDLSKPIKTTVAVAANASASSSFTINTGGSSQIISVDAIYGNEGHYKAKEASQTLNFSPASSSFNVNINYFSSRVAEPDPHQRTVQFISNRSATHHPFRQCHQCS